VTRGAAAVVGLGLLALLPLARLAARADPLRGERVFQRCYACHSVVAGEENLPGPSLRCVLGRRAGTLPGFRYSPAMIEAGAAPGLVWTRATLDAFLVDPLRLVPETAMSMPGLPAAEDRRDVIDYLASVGPCANAAPTPMPR
jgi:cytochrome c